MFRKTIMIGAIGIMAMGSPAFGFGEESNAVDGKVTQQAQATTKQYVHMKVENALDLIAFLGKDIKDLNIPQEAIEYIGALPFTVYYDAYFLGQPCANVSLGFSYDYATKINKAKDAYITLKTPDFMACKAYLDSLLGECHDCGTLPYAAVNGGAQTYFTYYKDGVKYHLTMGSANSFYRLQLSLGNPKNPPNRQSIGLVATSGMVGSFGMGAPSGFFGTGMASNTSVNTPAQPVENKQSWFCPNCGRKNFWKFCEDCGTKKP